MILSQLKTTFFQSGKKYTFVLPMGATEQHGPFLPLGTDTYCQDAILAKVIKECPEVIFLPTLEITCSKEHHGFPGTVWVEKETMMLMLRDIVTSLQEYADHIIFTSWHGGNLSTIDRFIREHQAQFEPIQFHHIRPDSKDVLRKTEEIIGGPVDDHAGNTEISMTLSVQKKIVEVPLVDYPKHNIIANWDDSHPLKGQTPDGIVDIHPRWVVSEEQGRMFIDLSAEHLKKEIQMILD